jgi:antitoxin ParD1/3/4
MNVSLTSELDSYVSEKVKSGLYNSASEVIREGLRLLKEQDLIRDARLEEVCAQVRAGLEQLEGGKFREYASAEEFDKALKAEMRHRPVAQAKTDPELS